MGSITASELIGCILLTLKIALFATVISSCMGLALAWYMLRINGPTRRFVDAICSLPLVLPPTVVGYCLILLIGRKGFFGPLLEKLDVSLIFTWQGAVVAATVVVFPLTYRSSKAALESVDHNLENAARTLGASEAAVFFRISLPLAWRNIAAGVSLAFARGMGEFGATLMVAGNIPGKGQTLALAIYGAFQAGNDGKAIALVILTSILCVFLLLCAEMFTSMKFSRKRQKLA